MKQLEIKYKPFIHLILSLLTILIIFSCSDTGPSEKISSEEKKKDGTVPEIHKKPPSSFRDTLIVSGQAAVFYNSDSLQLDKIKSITEKMVYESNIHDCFYQMRNARMVLKKYWPKIQIIETTTHRYLLFVKTDKTNTIIDLNSKGDICGLFLFDGKKEPQLSDMTNIDTQLFFYFSK